MKRISFLLVASVAALTGSSGFALAQGSAAEREFIVIILQPDAVVEDSVIYLDQIAKVTGSGPLRQRIAKLDVGELKVGVERVAISAEQVRFRLLLAEIDSARFRVSGSKQTQVRESDAPITPRKIVAAAEEVVRLRYPGNRANATFAAQNRVILPTISLTPTDRVRFEAKVRGSVPLDGRARAEVTILVNGEPREFIAVTVDVVELDPIVQVAAKGLRTDVKPIAPAPKAEVIVKTRDTVKMVQYLSVGRLETLGEAQQDGRLGEMIRVRNIASNRVVVGRVEALGVVVVGN